MRGLTVTSLADDILTGHEALDPVLEELLAFKRQMDLEVIGKEARRGLHAIVQLRDDDPAFLAHNPGWEPTGRYLGIFPGRVIPAGFKAERLTVGVRRDGQLRTLQSIVPDPETWERARLAWRMRVVDRASCRQIHEAARLYKKPHSYSNLFRNRLYTGVLEFGGEPDPRHVSRGHLLWAHSTAGCAVQNCGVTSLPPALSMPPAVSGRGGLATGVPRPRTASVRPARSMRINWNGTSWIG
jgi:hypothetical protein